MKWTFQFQNKIKTALLLLVVAVTILGCSFLEERYMSKMSGSVSSIYKDRLMPEADLFHINNHMFKRRLAMEKFLLSPATQNRQLVAQKLNEHNRQIDSLIAAFEATNLVPEESTLLSQIKANANRYHQLETAEFMANSQGPAPQAYEEKLAPMFDQIHEQLLDMSQIQTTIGSELYHDSRIIKGSAWAVGYLQIAIVVLVTLAVHALLFSARSAVPKKFQQVNWN